MSKYLTEADAEKFERALTVGDRVLVLSPLGDDIPSCWVPEMMDYVGEYGIVVQEEEGVGYILVKFKDDAEWYYTREQLAFVRTDKTDSVDVRVTLDDDGVWHTVGRKDDSMKPIVVKGCIQMFPEAIRLVSSQSEQGAERYGWDNWKNVQSSRYLEALGRHLLENDIVAVAWNALAVLQLRSEGK